MLYLIMKVLHVLCVVIFLGNITVGIFWKRYAEKKNDQKTIADTFGGIIKADRIFTMPAVAGILIFGFGASGVGGFPVFQTGWILWSLVLIIISGAVFMAKVVPVQKKIYALASGNNFSREEYESLAKQWEMWGLIATIAPYIAFALMIFRWPA